MLYAMFAMVILTTSVGVIAVTSRVQGVRNKQIPIKAFRTMQGELPDFVLRTTRNYNNQFELPVLFYVACTLYLALGIHSTFALATAWLFVFSRVIHAIVHLTYNNILHRMCVFWIGVILALALWVNLVIQHQ
jgi:hypothetical protein